MSEVSVFEFDDSLSPSRSAARARRKAEKAKKRATVGGPLQARTPNQRIYLDHLTSGRNVFGIGPAGTGKTYLPARLAAKKLLAGSIDKIILCRVTVSDPKHANGFLPGKLENKMAPWLVPIFDAIRTEMGAQTFEKFQNDKKIEVCSFEHMRGRTFTNCVVILDEAQNASFSDLKTFLTRIGEDCQVVVTGDLDQVDIRDSGLFRIIRMAQQYSVPMDVVEFGPDDVVRSAFTKAWVQAFAAEKAANDDPDVGILDHYPAFLQNGRNVTKTG